MTVPVELLVWIGGGIFAQLTLCVHILIIQNGKITGLDTSFQLLKLKFELSHKSEVEA